MQTITVKLINGKTIIDKVDDIWFLQMIGSNVINRYTAEEFLHTYLSDDQSSKYEVQTTTFYTWEIPIIFGHSEITHASIGYDSVHHIREFFDVNPSSDK